MPWAIGGARSSAMASSAALPTIAPDQVSGSAGSGEAANGIISADGDSGGSSTPVAELNTTSPAARANRSVSTRA